MNTSYGNIKRLLKKVVVIIAITISSTIAIGETNQNFDTLLDAYIKAKVKYKFAKDMDQMSEIGYWMKQYYFYNSKITQLLNNIDQSAQKDPRTYCLQALKMFYKYSEVDASVLILGELPSLYNFTYSRQLATYCSRYDIYYDPSQEKM